MLLVYMNTGVIKLSYKVLKVSEEEWDSSKECKQKEGQYVTLYNNNFRYQLL